MVQTVRLTIISYIALVLSAILFSLPADVSASGNQDIYRDSLAGSWSDWSWSSAVSFESEDRESGSKGISVRLDAWGGFYLHSGTPIDTSLFPTLGFALRSASDNPQLVIHLYDSSGNAVITDRPLQDYGGSPKRDTWDLYTIGLRDVVSTNGLQGFAIQNKSSDAVSVSIDSIVLNGSGTELAVSSPPDTSGLRAVYYDNQDFSGTTWEGLDRTLNFDWKAGSPKPGIAPDTYSAIWSGMLTVPHDDTYEFTATADDGVRLTIDGNRVIDRFIDQSRTDAVGSVRLAAGQHPITVEYYERYGEAVMQLSWKSSTWGREIVPAAVLTGGVGSVVTPTPVRTTETAGQSTDTPAITATPDISPPQSSGGTYTVGNGNVYRNGTEIRLNGINWFGFETEVHVPHGLWQRNWKEMIAQIKSLGFTSVRIPVCPDTIRGAAVTGIDTTLNPDLVGLDSAAVLDRFMAEFDRQSLYVLLDHHRPDCTAISELWYTGGYSEEAWIADLVTLARRYRGNAHFLGIDLKNEPHGQATWGTGNRSTDWNLAAERAGAAVHAANPDILIFVEGIGENPVCSGTVGHFWGENLEPMRCVPISSAAIPTDKLVLSPHVYGPDVNYQSYFSDSRFPSNMQAIWEEHFGFLTDLGRTVIPGEWGGKYGTRGGNPQDVTWQDAFAGYMSEKGICNSYYWNLNPNSGDTGGILKDDWITVEESKHQLLTTYRASCSGHGK